jgi:beta-lactamase regulating signal transducer with metallopeptidase domain
MALAASVIFPAPTWQLTTVCHSSSRCNTFLWALWAVQVLVLSTYIQANTHIKEKIKKQANKQQQQQQNQPKKKKKKKKQPPSFK